MYYEFKALDKALEDWTRYQSASTAFDDILRMILASFGPRISNEEGQWVSLYEAEYLEVVGRYEAQHVRNCAPALLAELIKAYREGVRPDGGWCDPLGNYLEQQIGSKRSKQRIGQFFTPPHVCDMMAKMVVGSQEPQELRIADPACGSSRNLIAFDRACHPDSFNFYVGTDIDWTCVAISAINFLFHGMRGVLIHGDTLRLECWGGYRVYAPTTGLGIWKLRPDQCMSYLVSVKKQSQPEPSSELPSDGKIPSEQIDLGRQLRLF